MWSGMNETLKYTPKKDLARAAFSVFKQSLQSAEYEVIVPVNEVSFNGGVVSALGIIKQILKESCDEIELDESNPDIIKGAKRLKTEMIWEIEEFANVFTKQYDKEEE